MTIYENIKRLCEKKGISMTALESKAGLARGITGKWRNSYPNLGSLRKIAAVLGVTIDELIEEAS